MKVAVWDTYVKRADGKVMHFDILAPDNITDEEKIHQFGIHYLDSKAFQTGQLTARECRLCHIEQASEEVIDTINEQGYSIIEFENCQ